MDTARRAELNEFTARIGRLGERIVRLRGLGMLAEANTLQGEWGRLIGGVPLEDTEEPLSLLEQSVAELIEVAERAQALTPTALDAGNAQVAPDRPRHVRRTCNGERRPRVRRTNRRTAPSGRGGDPHQGDSDPEPRPRLAAGVPAPKTGGR